MRLLSYFNLLRAAIVMYVVLVSVSSAASHVQVTTEGVGADGKSAQLSIDLVEGEQQVADFLEQNSAKLTSSKSKILVSDLGPEELAKHLSTADVQVVDSSKGGQTVAFLEIDEKPQERDITRGERVKSLFFATIQTGISATSFIYISKLPLEPAVTATMLAAFFNFYFNWDIERWSNFLYRGHNAIGKIAAKLGHGDIADREWFRETSKAASGYVGTVAFAAVFTGIAHWDHLMSEVMSNGQQLVAGIFASSMVSFLLSQPFDNTFGRWLKNGHTLFSRSQTQTLMRFKSLITAAITPLLYIGFEPIYPVAASFFLTGVSLVIYDQGFYVKESFEFSWQKIRQSLRSVWREKIKKPLCERLFR
jgi:hypothetical protein